MEIETLHLVTLRNEEHYKFQLDFSALVTQFTPETLGIQTLFSTYQTALAIETTTLNVVRGSTISDELADADTLRDETFGGFAGTVKSALNHYNTDMQKAANKLKRLLDTYENMTIKPYDQETAAIIKLVEELEGTYAADVATLGITGWVEELKTRNLAFDTLKNQRYTENNTKPQQNLKAARYETDKTYKAITKRINALVEVNGQTAYAGFVTELNQRIENYNNVLAQRKGRNAKDKESGSDGEAEIKK